MSSEGWRALGQHITQARRSSGTPRRADFAETIGVSVSTLYNLEAARRTTYSSDTMAAVEIALGWQPGSFQRVVEGGRPVRARDEDLERLLRAWQRLPVEARRMLVQVAEIAVGDRSS